MSGRATRGPRAEDVLGWVTLVTGKEELLNERTVVAVRDAVRRHDAEAEISETQAAGLTLAELGEMSAPSLFSTVMNFSNACGFVSMLVRPKEAAVVASRFLGSI